MQSEAATRLERHLQFLAADPQNAELLARCADLALEAGQPAEARSLAERGLLAKPGDPYMQARLATARMAAGEVDEAIGAYRSLIASGQDAPALRYNLGYALLASGRAAEAKEALVPAAAQMPEAAVLLVRAHHHLGELD